MSKNIISIMILSFLAYFMGAVNAQGNEVPIDLISKCPMVIIKQHNESSSLEACKSFGKNLENLLVIKKNKIDGINISVYKNLEKTGLDIEHPLMHEDGLGLNISNFNLGRFLLEDIDGDGRHELLIRSSNRSFEHFYSFTLDLVNKKFVDIGGENRRDGDQSLQGHHVNLAPNSLVFYENKRLMIRTPGEDKKIYRFIDGRFKEKKRPNQNLGLDFNN